METVSWPYARRRKHVLTPYPHRYRWMLKKGVYYPDLYTEWGKYFNITDKDALRAIDILIKNRITQEEVVRRLGRIKVTLANAMNHVIPFSAFDSSLYYRLLEKKL